MKRESAFFSPNENDARVPNQGRVAIWLSALPRVSSFTKGWLVCPSTGDGGHCSLQHSSMLALIIGIGLEGVTKIQRGGGVNTYSDNILLVDPSISETDLTLF